MWRALLLGKLGISIAASLVVGVLCYLHGWRAEGLEWTTSLKWLGVGTFFLLVAVLQVVVIVLLTRKPR